MHRSWYFIRRSYSAAASMRPFSELPGPKARDCLPANYTIENWYYDMMDKYQTYGKIFKEEIAGTQLVHIFDLDDISKLAKIEEKCPHKLPINALKHFYTHNIKQCTSSPQSPVGGGCLSNLNGPQWHDLRQRLASKLTSPSFIYHPKIFNSMGEISLEMTERLHCQRDDRLDVSIVPDFYRWAIECVGLLCYDARLGAVEQSNQDTDKLALNLSRYHDSNVFCQYDWRGQRDADTGHFKASMRCLEQLHALTRKYVDVVKKLDDCKGGGDIGGGCGNNDEFLSLPMYLINTAPRKEQAMEDTYPILVDFMLNGVDALAHKLVNILYLLARNPDAQKRLIMEINRFFPINGRRGKNTPSFLRRECLSKMTYLAAVQKESSRMLPTYEGTMRQISKNVLLSKYIIPSGSNIFLHNGVMGMIGDYFPEPERFVPERWLLEGGGCAGAGGSKGVQHGLLNYGFGNRICMGKNFSQMVMACALIRIFQKFRVEYDRVDFVQGQRVSSFCSPVKFKFVDL